MTFVLGAGVRSPNPWGLAIAEGFSKMKTASLTFGLALVAVLWGEDGCSRSSSNQLATDGSTWGDAPAGAGGLWGGSGGGGALGTGGSSGMLGTDAGAGGGIPDGPQDLPLGSGGMADANRDLATTPETGGSPGSGGRGGGGGAGAGGGGSGGASGAGGKTGSGGATGSGGSSGLDGGLDAGPAEILCSYECRADASGVTGWYSGNTLLCTASCTGQRAICRYGGTRSEGCYAQSTGCSGGYQGLIAYTTCAPTSP